MRTTVRWACVAVLALLLAGTASPAAAKGPTDVTVQGPDVHADLTSTRRGGDIDVGSLGMAAHLFRHWDGSGLAAEPPLTADQLGPRYVLTWTVGHSGWAVQHVYPFAEGGAWAHFVSVPGSGSGGWVRAPALRKQLVALGAGAVPEEPAVDAEPASVVADPVGAADPSAIRDDPAASYDVVVAAGLGLALAVLAGGVLVVRRRRLGQGRAVS